MIKKFSDDGDRDHRHGARGEGGGGRREGGVRGGNRSRLSGGVSRFTPLLLVLLCGVSLIGALTNRPMERFQVVPISAEEARKVRQEVLGATWWETSPSLPQRTFGQELEEMTSSPSPKGWLCRGFSIQGRLGDGYIVDIHWNPGPAKFEQFFYPPTNEVLSPQNLRDSAAKWQQIAQGYGVVEILFEFLLLAFSLAFLRWGTCWPSPGVGRTSRVRTLAARCGVEPSF